MYRISEHFILRELDNAYIPLDPANRDYQQYERWLSEGNEPEPYIKPTITKSQFTVREFLSRFTLEEQIAIRSASMTDMEIGLVYDDINRAQIIDVNDPYIAQGIDLYISKGLLNKKRKAAIMATEEIQ